MTDFFAELEEHLHTAARRRARRPRPGLVLAVAATAATVALVFVGLARIDTADPEVAAPVPTATATATASSCDEPPQAVLNRFAVLRRAPTDADRAPDEVLRRVDQDFPGVGRPARIWPEAGRLARTLGDDDYRSPGDYTDVWLFPVVLDGCRPAVCWVSVDPETSLAYCHRLEEVRRPVTLVTDEGRVPSVSALVPDGGRAIGVNGKARFEGTTEGNIFFAKGATEIEDADPGPPPGCETPALSEELPPPELLDVVPSLGEEDAYSNPERLMAALAGLAVRVHPYGGARAFGTYRGLEISAVAYSPLSETCGIDRAPSEAGACLVGTRPGPEYAVRCFTGTQIAQGRALVADRAAGVAYALVPAGTKAASLGGREMRIFDNFAHLATGDPAGRMTITR